MFLSVLFLTGVLLGHVASWTACRLLLDPANPALGVHGLLNCINCGQPASRSAQLLRGLLPVRCHACGAVGVRWPLAVSLSTGLLFAMFGWALVVGQCQTVEEVLPSAELWRERLPFHLLFLFLLLIATITDLLEYVIPDVVICVGVLLAVLLASASGELQMIHIWVNWDADLAEIYGPYRPAWMDQHRHLHGLAWSTAGIVAGAGLMAIIRLMARSILGYSAVGLGDVTLMAMIGAFVGWQPVLCVLAVAPLAGIVIGFLVRTLSGRSFVAFGPYLAFAAVAVLFTWRLLWQKYELRLIFSHWPTVIALVLGALGAMSLLLGLVRLMRAIPTSVIRR